MKPRRLMHVDSLLKMTMKEGIFKLANGGRYSLTEGQRVNVGRGFLRCRDHSSDTKLTKVFCRELPLGIDIVIYT